MREEKQLLLDEIKEKIEGNGNFIVFNYDKLTANNAGEFRDELAKLGGAVTMVPRRMFHKAAAEAGVSVDLNNLPGHLGLAFTGDDVVTTAKKMFEFGGEAKVVNVLAGQIDGRFYWASDVEKLSKLPGMDQMRAQLLATLAAPMAQTLSVMNALLTSVVYCLDNKVEQANKS